jgi:hypothetical protein
MGRMNGTSIGCWRGKEMRTSRWISNPIRYSRVWLRVQLSVQDHLDFKLMYKMHTTSYLDVLHIHGKRQRQTLKWHQSQVQLKSDSIRISKIISISRVQLIQKLSILKLIPRSWTPWKGKEITFPMEQVPCPNSLGINRDHQNKWMSKICLGAAPPFLAFGSYIVSSSLELHPGGTSTSLDPL